MYSNLLCVVTKHLHITSKPCQLAVFFRFRSTVISYANSDAYIAEYETFGDEYTSKDLLKNRTFVELGFGSRIIPTMRTVPWQNKSSESPTGLPTIKPLSIEAPQFMDR